MAQTQNGERIYDYYTLNTDILEFAHDWMQFFTDTRLGNKFHDWHKYCDEFAKWVISSPHIWDTEAFGLVRGEEEEE